MEPEGLERKESQEVESADGRDGVPEAYEEVGMLLGYRVFVCYAQDGPDREEAMALYQEAKRNALLHNLAAMGGEEE